MAGLNLAGMQQHLAFDENGQPFIILREQGRQKRLKGLEAHKVSPTEQLHC